MLQSILSVIVGYGVMTIIVMIGTVAAAAALLQGGLAAMRSAQGPPTPSKNYLYANLAISLVAAIVAGWIAARMAPSAPFLHAAALAVLVAAMSTLTSRTQKSQYARQPYWYPRTIAILGVIGVLIGGFVELRSVVV